MDSLQSQARSNDTHGYISTFRNQSPLQLAIHHAGSITESECVKYLLTQYDICTETRQRVTELALKLSQHLRDRENSAAKVDIIQGLLQEFSLSSDEGIALMCLAEALLRIPDQATRDELIRDKINQGNWKQHLGNSKLVFVNAAAWGLMLTGKLMQPRSQSLSGLLTQIIERCGRGIIRKAVHTAIEMMGEQFVMGETIEEALHNAKRLEQQGFRYSYDMLGEAALTEQDAQRYYQDYVHAIHCIGQATQDLDVYAGAGISIKLSALHPRYQRAQVERVQQELYPRILELACLAKQYNIGLNIDAEETERLEISLNLLERLCFEPALEQWQGIGFVLQAYQKRGHAVVDYVIDLAKRSKRRLMIRLVKGAYWDSEVKKAQIDGLSGFPVFTQKAHTDLSYIICAKKLLMATEHIYPQFATHNAHTLATVYTLATSNQPYTHGQYELQCLHGMGEPLYEQVVGSIEQNKLGIPCRIYAPVGSHKTLLAYLVRRLLENGANTSFVHRINDKTIQLSELITDPHDDILNHTEKGADPGQVHRNITLPPQLYGALRVNALGFDLDDEHNLAELDRVAIQLKSKQWYAGPMGEQLETIHCTQHVEILNPANHLDCVGNVQLAHADHVEQALINACTVQHTWANWSRHDRGMCLLRAADLLSDQLTELLVLLSRESGKTYSNALAEVREAIDFMRYYAAQIQNLTTDTQIEPLGPVLCISPWNFPLAIFLGQISASLLAGNTVIAKPAEQTPLVAAFAIQCLWQAGVPRTVIQMLPGAGEIVAAQLSADPRIQAILFTGSTAVAKLLQQTLAQRVSQHAQPVTLVAETAGQNAMIVDSSALNEQAVTDIIQSAFDSAGQRCSALRLLCVQQDNAHALLEMLKGAMQQLSLGQPSHLNTDIGPVIDIEAQQNILKHIEKLSKKGCPVYQCPEHFLQQPDHGTFVAPTLIELSTLDELQEEIFGPVLHVIYFKQGQIKSLVEKINAKGYGLTMGLHSRLEQHIDCVKQYAKVGNLYINRNMVGAVVGVQPFGGEGLSGTGPKAGGPLYLYRLMHHCSHKQLSPPFATYNTQQQDHPSSAVIQLYQQWVSQHFPSLQLAEHAPIDTAQALQLIGPTGESNTYQMIARTRILCIANQEEDLIQQFAVVLNLGSQVVISEQHQMAMRLTQLMPPALAAYFHKITQLQSGDFDLALHHGSTDALLVLQQDIAQRQGPMINIVHLKSGDYAIPIERLMLERVVSNNTAAAGGNTSLMSMSDF